MNPNSDPDYQSYGPDHSPLPTHILSIRSDDRNITLPMALPLVTPFLWPYQSTRLILECQSFRHTNFLQPKKYMSNFWKIHSSNSTFRHIRLPYRLFPTILPKSKPLGKFFLTLKPEDNFLYIKVARRIFSEQNLWTYVKKKFFLCPEPCDNFVVFPTIVTLHITTFTTPPPRWNFEIFTLIR